MVGCCKFGPCRKKRTYEFNNPPYTANKEDGFYHSHKQPVKNRSAHMSRTNPAFESGSADNLEFNGAAVVDLDSECNSIAEDGGAMVRRKDSKHKENAEGFKSADLVVANRKDSKRSSKSSHSSSSSSSKGSKRSSKHSDVVKVNDEEDKHSEHVDVDQIETHVVTTTTTVTATETHEHVEEIEGGAVAYPDDENQGDDVVVKREEITETIVDGEVTKVEIKKEITIKDDDGETTSERRKSDSSHSSKLSSSSDANSYQINEERTKYNRRRK